jgi:hypothetical protein
MTARNIPPKTPDVRATLGPAAGVSEPSTEIFAKQVAVNISEHTAANSQRGTSTKSRSYSVPRILFFSKVNKRAVIRREKTTPNCETASKSAGIAFDS